MKTLTTIPLTAMVLNNDHKTLTVATSQDFDNVVQFVGAYAEQAITVSLGEEIQLLANDIYLATLVKHSTQNYYHGTTLSGNKVQVSLKKMVGSLRVWS